MKLTEQTYFNVRGLLNTLLKKVFQSRSERPDPRL